MFLKHIICPHLLQVTYVKFEILH